MPHGINASDRFTLISAFESNPKRWTLRNWYNAYTGEPYRITTRIPGGGNRFAGVKSLGSVAAAYPYHPESKRCDALGDSCNKRTEGLLLRRPVRAGGLVCIGKEAHKLEERDLVSDIEELQSVHVDQRRDRWATITLPQLQELSSHPQGVALVAQTAGLSHRAARDIISGKSRSRRSVRASLIELTQQAESVSRVCSECGSVLASTDPRAKFCSPRCRSRAAKNRSREGREPARSSSQ